MRLLRRLSELQEMQRENERELRQLHNDKLMIVTEGGETPPGWLLLALRRSDLLLGEGEEGRQLEADSI